MVMADEAAALYGTMTAAGKDPDQRGLQGLEKQTFLGPINQRDKVTIYPCAATF